MIGGKQSKLAEYFLNLAIYELKNHKNNLKKLEKVNKKQAEDAQCH